MKLNLTKVVLFSALISTNSMAINKVIYGIDNRVDVHESNKAFLVDSVAAMVPGFAFLKDEEGNVTDTKFLKFPTLKYHRGYPTCGEMRFRDQPTIAGCSGFLIGENLIMTAGHCMISGGTEVSDQVTSKCRDNKWVFNYNSTSVNKDGHLEIQKSDVFGCKRVVAASNTGTLDYAIVELERKATDKKPLTLNLNASATRKGTDIYVAGYPTGLPLKVAAGAKVTSSLSYSNEFKTDLDTFGGNSGSPVLNNKDEVIGILVAGEIDYVFDFNKGCYKVNVCKKQGGVCERQSNPLMGALGETVTKAASAYTDYILKKSMGPYIFEEGSDIEEVDEIIEEYEE
ncbi:trypsin [Bacteriovorax sp. BAL6_X]|uniref:trypsin-like serine peptidase n=1 Tax=Bacteriovorax sp. BAL6_X TaxID=1201290 RepID=UPI000386E1F5|nr:serine protease [Bacteriovorax sp. BAL6_X]EPZ51308.1 trypsin [Bacteriovorax sp. BAL6_X]